MFSGGVQTTPYCGGVHPESGGTQVEDGGTYCTRRNKSKQVQCGPKKVKTPATM